jgi:hypothetical protein
MASYDSFLLDQYANEYKYIKMNKLNILKPFIPTIAKEKRLSMIY